MKRLPFFTNGYFCWALAFAFSFFCKDVFAQPCPDCPYEIEQLPDGRLRLYVSANSIDDYPIWANSWPAMGDTYYTSVSGVTYGPLTLTSGGFGSPPPAQFWYIDDFPIQFPDDFEGSLTLGGIMRCNYSLSNENTAITCEMGDMDCRCPALGVGLNSDYVIFIQGQYGPGYPFQYNSTVDAVFEWGQSTAGPSVNPTWDSPNSFYVNFSSSPNPEQPPCCMPYTGSVIFNGTKTCYYEDHLPIGCGEDCDGLLDCGDALEDLVLNLPGTGCKKWESSCGTITAIDRNGKVRIGGAETPDGYKLAVAGGIMTDYIKVELCGTGGWCDYVFLDGYPLMPLSEVGAYISKRGHLPGIPSEKEIKASGGIETRSTMLIQQEKIEEIFLHMIELEEKVLAMEEEARSLEIENRILKITNK